MLTLAGQCDGDENFCLPSGLLLWGAQAPALAADLTLNSAATKVAHVGPVIWPDGGSHDIAKIGFLAGSVTNGSGSTFRVSLQDVSTATAGGVPDGVVDQAYTSAVMPTQNSYNEVTLSAARPNVAHGSLLSAVFDFSVFGASTAISINGYTASFTDGLAHCAYSSGSWSSAPRRPTVTLISSDGTVGKLGVSGFPASTPVTGSFNSGSGTNVLAARIVMPFAARITGIRALMTLANVSADFDAKIFDSAGNVLTTGSVDATQSGGVSVRPYNIPVTPIEVGYGQLIRVGIVPTTTNNVTVYTNDVQTAAEMALLPNGNAIVGETRGSGGTWGGAVNTRRYLIGVYGSRIGFPERF